MMVEKLEEIKQQDPRYYRKMTFFLGGAAFACLILLALFIQDLRVNGNLKKALGDLGAYEGRAKQMNVPSEERLVYLTKQLNDLKAIEEKLPRDLLYQEPLPESKTGADAVLQFKEKLFSLKQELRKQSQPDERRFPKKYGLEEYETRLPAVKDLSELYLRLDVVETVFQQLLADQKAVVEELVFTETVDGRFDEKHPESYCEYYARVIFYGNNQTLISFLEFLLEADFFYEIPSIEILPSDREESLPSELKVTAYLGIFKIMEPRLS